MSVVGRFFVVLLSYFVACAAAALVLTLAALTPAWDDVAALGLPAAALWVPVLFGAVFIFAVALLPSALALLVTEGLAVRSILVYAALGAVLALGLCYGIDFSGLSGSGVGNLGVDLGVGLARQREVLAAAGIAGGLTYWLLAGRSAGSWQRNGSSPR